MTKKKSCGCGCFGFILIFVALIIGIYLLLTHDRSIEEYFFPREYEETVEAACAEYGVDKWLAMAVIREESGFDIDASSSKSATGLMQIMPATATWIIEEAGFTFTVDDILSDPYCNIQAGCWYLAWLEESHYPDDMVCAVAAYNAGASVVDQWLADGTWNGELNSLGDIPYGETRQYVEAVFRSYEIYKKLYE